MERKRILSFAYLLLGTYVIAVLLLFVFQRSFIYLPTPKYEHGFEQISVQNENESIEVIVLNKGNENAFVYFGGNAEAVVANASEFSRSFPTTTVYLINYRGYGGSTGKPTESALFFDAELIFDHFSPQHRNLAAVGRSLGSGVAMHLAANRPVSKIVLITPYDSILALAKKQFPIFPISLLLKDKYDSISLANTVSVPTLVLAGSRDTLIPLNHSQNLIDAIGKDQAEMIIIEQAGHNNISQFPEFYANMIKFLEYN